MTITFDTQSVVNSIWGESITITPAEGTSYEPATVTAGRYKKGISEGATSYGVYTIQNESYTVATDALDFVPKIRDLITAADLNPNTCGPEDEVTRVIVRVNGTRFLKFYTLDVQYPSLAAELDQTATVYRPAPTPDAIGLRVANLAAVYSDQSCRLQPTGRSFEQDVAGKFVTRAIYSCIFGGALVLNAGDIVEVSSVRYEITGQSEIETLGLLTFGECTRIQ